MLENVPRVEIRGLPRMRSLTAHVADRAEALGRYQIRPSDCHVFIEHRAWPPGSRACMEVQVAVLRNGRTSLVFGETVRVTAASPDAAARHSRVVVERLLDAVSHALHEHEHRSSSDTTNREPEADTTTST